MSTIEIFENRKDYKKFDGSVIGISNLDSFRDPDPLDMWYHKNYYGRVDEERNAVYIFEETFAEQQKVVLISDGIYAVLISNAFSRMK